MGEWESGWTKEELIEHMAAALAEMPGMTSNFPQPMAMRLDETFDYREPKPGTTPSCQLRSLRAVIRLEHARNLSLWNACALVCYGNTHLLECAVSPSSSLLVSTS